MFSTQPTRSVRRALALAASAVALVGACSSSATAVPSASSAVAGATSAPSVAASVAPAASPSAAEASGSGSVYTVATSTKAGVGTFLTGEDGKTLYTFKKDSANTSTCTGGCATAWPPFTLDAGETVMAGSGVSVKLATTKRPDGSTQVTADGMPLYYFAKDAAAGDTNGQGIGGVWFVASPTSGGGSGAASPAASGGYSY